jgi:hypothetical protein
MSRLSFGIRVVVYFSGGGNMKGQVYRDVVVMPGTKMSEYLASKNPEDQKKAKRLHEFCRKAEACCYRNPEYSELRKHYKDVV